ncbi:carboxylesterase family protein [Thermoascus aurantiacus ATCC 26904]
MSDQWGSSLWRLTLSWFTTAILCQTVQSGLIPAPSSELYVETTTGPVYGFYNDTGRTVRTFLGIPYAEPPTGDRRFAPPVNKAPWDTVLHASSYSGPCPGIYSFSNESIWSYLPYIPWNIPDMTEDCLTVNIWAPGERHPGNSKKNNSKEKATVMMYIYGGGFNQGGTALTFYDGTNLVKDNENVVFVTFNYRVSVFGYPNAPEIDTNKQNVGLLDQRLAIEWVYNNIADFGGDPTKIMLFGQSAGAASADMYSYAYPTNPLVRAIGLESGVASLLPNTDFTYENWNRLAAALGCSSSSSSNTNSSSLECMRRLPFKAIVDEVTTDGTYSFVPVADNLTVFADYAERARERKIARLPTLMGGNERECAAYQSLDTKEFNETQQVEQTQGSFNCPIQEAALLRVEQDVPTWRYLYHGNFSNLSPVPWLGAYHSSEVPIVLGTYDLSPLAVDDPSSVTPEEVRVSRYMQGAWVAFAKDPWNGLAGGRYRWPLFDPNKETLINLALNNSDTAVFTSASAWDSHCQGGRYVP